MSESAEYEGWSIVELMGHRRLAGKVSEVAIAGAAMLRLDIYRGDEEEPAATQFYNATSLYCLTPSTEDLCRRFSRHAVPEPVTRYELPTESANEPSNVF